MEIIIFNSCDWIPISEMAQELKLIKSAFECQRMLYFLTLELPVRKCRIFFLRFSRVTMRKEMNKQTDISNNKYI